MDATEVLHDASLKTICLDWAKGVCTVVLAPLPGKECELHFVGVSEIRVPRKQPWGPSVSVNSVRELEAGVVQVELQSGDVVVVRCEKWSFREKV